jgi:hypothetical protein
MRLQARAALFEQNPDSRLARYSPSCATKKRTERFTCAPSEMTPGAGPDSGNESDSRGERGEDQENGIE